MDNNARETLQRREAIEDDSQMMDEMQREKNREKRGRNVRKLRNEWERGKKGEVRVSADGVAYLDEGSKKRGRDGVGEVVSSDDAGERGRKRKDMGSGRYEDRGEGWYGRYM